MTGDPYRHPAEKPREIDAAVELFHYGLARTRVRTIFFVAYPIAAIVVLGIAAWLGLGPCLIAIMVVALAPKVLLSPKGRRFSRKRADE